VLNEFYMERVEDAISMWIPKTERLRVRSISDEDTGDGTMVNLRVVSGDKGKSTTSKFLEVGEGRLATVPQFIRSLTVVCRSASEVSEVRSSSDELVPQVDRRVAGRFDRASFI
jgi:hypothetical protein